MFLVSANILLNDKNIFFISYNENYLLSTKIFLNNCLILVKIFVLDIIFLDGIISSVLVKKFYRLI